MQSFHVTYLHGFASSPGSNKAGILARALEADGHRVVIPDLNVPSFRDLTVTAMVEVAAREVESQPAPRMIIGSSLGAFVALVVAERVAFERLVLLAPAVDLARVNVPWNDEAVRRYWQETGVIKAFHHATGQAEDFAYTFYRDSLAYADKRFCPSMPTLLVHGTRDETIPLETSTELAEACARVELVTVDDDHQLLGSTDTITEAIRSFLDTTGE